MVNIISVGHPVGPSNSTCGYCSAPGERSEDETFYKTAGLVAHQLSNSIYQRMIDRGWRRSGTWCYKPHLKASCCPQYTIKYDYALHPSGSFQKPEKASEPVKPQLISELYDGQGTDGVPTKQGKGRKSEPVNLVELIHTSEWTVKDDATFAHKFEITLEEASFTKEKYELYCLYQALVHSDDDNTPSGFTGFLCNTPLRPEPIPYSDHPPKHLPKNYGSYHQIYRLDGKLIAIAVLDILPNCVSSVYFMYDPAYERFSLGKLSAFREISLTQEIHAAGAEEMRFLYLGFYIHSCTKMKYKGEYSPSFLADPETYEWFPLEHCKTILDHNRYATFSNPNHCVAGPATKQMMEQALYPTLDEIPSEDLGEISLVTKANRGVVYTEPVQFSKHWKDTISRREIICCIKGLGIDIAKEILFTL